MLPRLNAVQMSVFGLGLSWVGTTRPSMAANRVNNRIEEALLIKVSLIKHPAVGQTVVNWHQALTMRPAVRRESKEYFYVFLIALFPDQLFQLHFLCPCICDCKDQPIVRHVLQGFLDSWERNGNHRVFLLDERFFVIEL